MAAVVRRPRVVVAAGRARPAAFKVQGGGAAARRQSSFAFKEAHIKSASKQKVEELPLRRGIRVKIINILPSAVYLKSSKTNHLGCRVADASN